MKFEDAWKMYFDIKIEGNFSDIQSLSIFVIDTTFFFVLMRLNLIKQQTNWLKTSRKLPEL